MPSRGGVGGGGGDDDDDDDAVAAVAAALSSSIPHVLLCGPFPLPCLAHTIGPALSLTTC
jgi:hypothetical protein